MPVPDGPATLQEVILVDSKREQKSRDKIKRNSRVENRKSTVAGQWCPTPPTAIL
jgi:hypothetical protein